MTSSTRPVDEPPGAISEPGLASMTFEAWAARLAEHLFRPENEGMPIVLYLDDETIAEVVGVGDARRAVRSLTSAVRVRLSRSSSNVFRPILNEALSWKAGGGAGHPPFLPALAIAALAASHMTSEGALRSTNYYQRFRELLELPGRGEPDGYHETFPMLWRYLTWWLDEVRGGEVGRSTIVTSDTWPNIGYALSQTIMKRSDRLHLSELFEALGLVADDPEIETDELLSAYRAWVPHTHLSRPARQAATRPECAAQLAAILSAELGAWDGGVRDETGNRVAQIVIALELQPLSIELVAQRPWGFPQTIAARTGDGVAVTLRSMIDGWYQPIEVTASEALGSGLKLTAAGHTFRLPYRDVVPLRQDTTVGAWVSVRQIEPFVPHCVLVKEERRAAVSQHLERHAERGWSEHPVSRRLPPGWALFRGVTISEPPAVAVDEGLQALVPSVRGRVALAGGLRVASPLVDRQDWYLSGGEPDLWVPAWTSADGSAELTLDGLSIGELTSGSRLPLSGRDLSPGPHEVTVGSARRHFVTVTSRAGIHPELEGMIAQRLFQANGLYTLSPSESTTPAPSPLSGQVWIAGAVIAAKEADLPEPPAHVVRLRRGAVDHRVLGAHAGEILTATEPAPPSWLRRARLEPMFFDVTVPFRPVWALTRWQSSGWSARLVEHLGPDPAGSTEAPSEHTRCWAAAFSLEVRLAPGARALWDQYAGQARALP